MRVPALSVLLVLGMLAGCALTREVPISQGNQDLVAKIGTVMGMTYDEVRGELGPPQSRWDFGNETWVYYYQYSGRSDRQSLLAEIMFDTDGKVSDVRILDNSSDTQGR